MRIQDTWQLQDPQKKTIVMAKGSAGSSVNLLTGEGKALATLTCEQDTCRLMKDEKLVFRIKEKVDKTNLYDGSDKRLYKVKTKPDGFSLKSAHDSSTVWKVKGAKGIKEASLFAAPLTLEERLVLWRAFVP